MESSAFSHPRPSDSPVLGVPLAIADYETILELTRSWVEDPEGRAWAVGVAATHFVSLSRCDSGFRKALERFDIITADGMPCVWSMNFRGAGMKDRVYGPSLMLHAARQGGVSHFLLGGSQEMLEKLEANLRQRVPWINIAGAYSPPFGEWGEEEDARIRERIAASGANYIWVGLGVPKQEFWISRNKPLLPPGVYFGVGAAFAFHSGDVRQAPSWMQKRGLEWLFRLLMEPRRLWKRYAVYNSLFILFSLKEFLFGPVPPISRERESAE